MPFVQFHTELYSVILDVLFGITNRLKIMRGIKGLEKFQRALNLMSFKHVYEVSVHRVPWWLARPPTWSLSSPPRGALPCPCSQLTESGEQASKSNVLNQNYVAQYAVTKITLYIFGKEAFEKLVDTLLYCLIVNHEFRPIFGKVCFRSCHTNHRHWSLSPQVIISFSTAFIIIILLLHLLICHLILILLLPPPPHPPAHAHPLPTSFSSSTYHLTPPPSHPHSSSTSSSSSPS